MPRRMIQNFAKTKRIDPRITFTRASAGTRFDAFGALKTEPENTARFDHDPVTGECKGLLIEEARTNLLLNSASLATQSITTTAAARTLSFYGTGTVILSGTHSATVVGVGSFPTRTTYTYTPSAGTLTLTVTGTVVYANDELGSFATSWIPTTGATATRAADIASMTGANFSSWYRQDEGTFVAGFSRPVDGMFQTVVAASDGTTANCLVVGHGSGTRPIRTDILAGGVSQASIVGLAASSSQVNYRVATAHKANDFAISVNSGAAATDAAGSVPTVNRLWIGLGAAGTVSMLNGHIARIAYFPSRLSNAELQALSL